MIFIVTYCESMRGTLLLKVGQYTYFKKNNYSKNLRARWVCSTHQCKGCRASVHTLGENICKHNNKHNHPPSKMKRMYQMKAFR
ncbi:Modifier of mdg4, partial [Operophtera brumata]